MVQSVTRYIQYYKFRIRIPLMSAFEYRGDIFMSMMGTLGYTFVSLVFLNSVLNEFETIGGWNKYEILILFSMSQFIFYFYFSFFSSTWNNLSTDIEEGNLDHLFTKPVSPVFNHTTQDFELLHMAIPMLIPISLTMVALQHIDIPSIGAAILTIISLVLSITIFYCILFFIQCLSFWWSDTGPITRIWGNTWDFFARYPATIYPPVARVFFLTLFPVALLAYAPSYFLTRGIWWPIFLLQIIVTIFFVTLAVIIWKKGTRAYSSASS